MNNKIAKSVIEGMERTLAAEASKNVAQEVLTLKAILLALDVGDPCEAEDRLKTIVDVEFDWTEGDYDMNYDIEQDGSWQLTRQDGDRKADEGYGDATTWTFLLYGMECNAIANAKHHYPTFQEAAMNEMVIAAEAQLESLKEDGVGIPCPSQGWTQWKKDREQEQEEYAEGVVARFQAMMDKRK